MDEIARIWLRKAAPSQALLDVLSHSPTSAADDVSSVGVTAEHIFAAARFQRNAGPAQLVEAQAAKRESEATTNFD